MADLVLAYDIINDTAADAVPVQSNYTRIESHVNNNVIRTDGATVMTAPLQLFGDPVGANDAVRKGFLDLLMPVGVILPYGGVAVPGGLWALANGAALSTTVYPDLFTAMGYNFGGSGSTFNLPDLRGRTMMGRSAAAPFTSLNAPGGSADAAVVAHSHAGVSHDHAVPGHAHGINVYTGNEIGAHTHGPESGAGHQFAVVAGSILAGSAVEGPGASIFKLSGAPTGNAGTTIQSANHHHPINSATDAIPATTTSQATPSTTNVTTPASEPAANRNLPPYIVVNFIVRVS